MIKRLLMLILILLCLGAYSGCSSSNSNPKNVSDTENNGNRSKDTTDHGQEPETVQKEIDPLQEKVKEMNLDEKIGQMVMVGVDDYVSDDHAVQMIQKYHVGGFILFKRNIKDVKQSLDLINSLKDTNLNNKFPLFFSIDEEGGRISRMPDNFVKIPANQVIGRVNNSDFSYAVGKVIAQELKAFGINMDFAPVLDINSNPKNPVIGDRSFGPDADIVSKLGVQAMKGLQSENIIPVVKHFPGHGDTSEDSHTGLPVVNHPVERLKSFEFVPFIQAVENRADAVMVAHLLLTKIDRDNPASLSKTVITDILRKDLKFDGVVITDDMTMGAIVKKYDIGEAAVKSVNAGSDIVLVCHDFEKQAAVIHALKKACETGVISEEKINSSVYRIIKLKQKYGLTNQGVNSVDVDSINHSISSVLNKYLNNKK